MRTLDVRGLACPEPIVRAKKAMVDDGEPALLLLVDSAVTRDNLEKFAASKGFTFAATEVDAEWEISITGGTMPTEPVAGEAVATRNLPVILCKTPFFGNQSGELGRILIRAFFKTLLDIDQQPARVIFVNEGVNLPCDDEQVIEYCRELERRGCEIVSCGTCLDYFGLLDELQVGRVGNMYDIAGALLEAGHVVEP